MVLAECAIVAALAMVAWHLVTGSPARAVPMMPAASPAADAGNGGGQESSGVVAKPKPSAGPVLPGLNVDAAFWRVRLAELNRGQAAFEALEWRLVHSAMDTARRYIESVVIPTIARAERRGG